MHDRIRLVVQLIDSRQTFQRFAKVREIDVDEPAKLLCRCHEIDVEDFAAMPDEVFDTCAAYFAASACYDYSSHIVC